MFDNEGDSRQLNRRERERKRHREEILEAASEVFGRFGFEKTSMQMIADKAELSVGKIYTHFEGKEAIYRELIEYIVSLVRQRCEETVRPGMPPLEIIRVKMRTSMNAFRGHIPFIRLYYGESDLRKGLTGEAEYRHHMTEISSLLKEAIENGEFSADIDPESHALMMEGAAHRLVESVSTSGVDSFGKVAELIDKVFLKQYEIKRQE